MGEKREIIERDENGNIIYFEKDLYDENGRFHTTIWFKKQYDKYGRVIGYINHKNRVRKWTYDKNGNISSYIDEKNSYWVRKYKNCTETSNMLLNNNKLIFKSDLLFELFNRKKGK